MTLRITLEEARALGISDSEIASGRARVKLPAGPSAPTSPKEAKPGSRRRSVGFDPQQVLWEAVRQRHPAAVSELAGVITGRRFRIDIGFPEERVAVEVDGWEYHGKYKKDFLRDREKRNLLSLQGWVVLAYPAGRIASGLQDILDEIEKALTVRRSLVSQAVTNSPRDIPA